MFKSKSALIICLLLVVLLATLAACGESSPTPPATQPDITTPTISTTAAPSTTSKPAITPQVGGTLRIIWSNPPASGFGWGPKIFGGEGFPADPAMEPLMDGKFIGGFEPRLATDYKVSSDGLSITFTLRQGVKFHDGTDFNAEAVKFNVDAMIKAGKYGKNILSCDVTNSNTVSIKLARFENISLGTVAGTVIASPTAVQKNGENWAAINAVGTGPFKQVSYEPDVKIRLERWDGYWGQKAYLDAIEGTFIADRMTQIMAMKSGAGDATHSRQAKTTSELTQAGLKVLQNFMGMVALNLNSRDENSPFYDVRVRMATEYAINKNALVKTLGFG
ncbi:MAG TPA: ABC transporter substrate-binding protein, partial [Dehalococcoidales bacterium]|nr:ABC transporter substrate-binding protein [Dehalococcoidales bacterium]